MNIGELIKVLGQLLPDFYLSPSFYYFLSKGVLGFDLYPSDQGVLGTWFWLQLVMGMILFWSMMIKAHGHIDFDIIKGEFEFQLNQVDQSKILIKTIFATMIINSD